jgi:hypothetical protein
MPFEGGPFDAIPVEVEMVGARRGRGTYTDDTQMMIALAESLIERGRVDEEHLARAFRESEEELLSARAWALRCGPQHDARDDDETPGSDERDADDRPQPSFESSRHPQPSLSWCHLK